MNIGEMRHVITLENPVAQVPDGDGGYTESWAPLVPGKAYASIVGANARSLERFFASTVTVQATYIVKMRFHPDVSTQTRISWVDRAHVTHLASVTDMNDIDFRGAELALLVAEITD
jgi:head-tail adaptor